MGLRGPKVAVTWSSRVDRVGRSTAVCNAIRIVVAAVVALVMLIPVLWMGLTAFKSRPDTVAIPPKVFFTPTLEGIVNLLTDRAQLPEEQRAKYAQRSDLKWHERMMARRGQIIIGQSKYVGRLRNSLIIAGGSTVIAVMLGFFAGYAFSRFEMRGKSDWLFFILSTRMLPAVVVTIPIFLMYRELGLYDTHFGLILLYTAFNLSFSIWLLRGFIDEIPRQYEDAALVDGYTRLHAFWKVVLPQSITGIAASTVFCFIFAWNEYAFALMLTSRIARTAPPAIPSALGRGGIEWATVAAGALGFLVPVVIVTFLLRKYLLRGVSFGAIRQ